MAAPRAARTNTAIGLGIFVGVLIVYIVTLCPTIYPGQVGLGAPLGESLRAVTTATHTAFIKSVEYPVWRFLARLFTGVSPNKAWALNLLSAIFGAAAIGLLYAVFSRFAHTRTRDELVRFRGQPWLPQFFAVAAALLVAFSHTFWRASITAGTHTLNALLLVAVTYWLLRYRETRKKRYFMLYGVVYALGIVNFPTMLLLLPVFLVLSILWCRDAYADWITLGITVLIGAVLFAIFMFSGPARFASGLPVYFLKPMPVTRPMFDYVKWYWSQVRPVLPLGGLGGALQWLVWLLLPTVPPVAYLAFSKAQGRGEMGRASTITDGVFRFLAFLYTIFGVMILLDLFLGPYAMSRLIAPTAPPRMGFVVVYMIIGGWVCYMLGYWAVMFTGRTSVGAEHAAAPAAFGEQRPAVARYSKGGYAVVVALCVLLPVASVVKHVTVEGTNLNGFTFVEDFARDTLISTAKAADREQPGDRPDTQAVLVVYDNWGDLLRYVHAYRIPAPTAEQITIADLRSAGSYDGLYIDKYAYLNELFVGRQLRPEIDPASNPTLTDTEAVLSYIRRSERLRAPVICLTSDLYRFDAQNDAVAYSYEAIPYGLVYLLSPREDPQSLPATHVARGREGWDMLSITNTEPRPLEQRPYAARDMLVRASKLANDFGVYCHKHADAADAIDFYKLSLRFFELNYAALQNLRIAGADVDFNLDDRIGAAAEDFDSRLVDRVAQALGPGPDPALASRYKKFRAGLDLMSIHGLVRDGSVIDDFLTAYLADSNAARSFPFRYAMASLKVLVDPAGDRYLAERGILSYRVAAQAEQPSLQRLVHALMDLRAAEPYFEGRARAEIYLVIGGVYAQLRNAAEAEEAYNTAMEIEPDWAGPKYALADLYVATGRRDEAVEMIEDYLAQHPPQEKAAIDQTLQALQRYYGPDRREEFVAFVEAQAERNPDNALNWRLYLVELALNEQDYERALEISDELIRAYGDLVSARVMMAYALLRQGQYDDVLAMEELPLDESMPVNDRINWLRIRGEAYFQEGQPALAYRELKKAFEFAERRRREQERSPTSGDVDLLHLLSYAALQGSQETGDKTMGEEALGYAYMYYQFAQRVDTDEPRQRETRSMFAAAYYGWVRFRINSDVRIARALIEPAYYAFSGSTNLKLYFGVMLIEQGEVERGLALVKQVLVTTVNRYEKAEAEQILAEHGVDLEEVAEQPAAAEEPAEPESLELISDEETEPSDLDETGLETETGETLIEIEPEILPED
jgi:tetratricopeptide (TPR) repeat protein